MTDAFAPSAPSGPRVDPAHLVDVLHATVRRDPDRVIFGRRTEQGWQDVPATQFLAEVVAVAKGFVAAGVQPGDRVAIMSKTRYEWTVVDFALWTAGAVSVPIYETSSAAQVEWILSDAGAVGCVVETAGHAERVASVRGRLPALGSVWQFEPTGGGCRALDALVAAGREVADDELAQRQGDLTGQSLATLIYTSGTTGRPKGCMLTHGNFVQECSSALVTLPELFQRDDASTLLFLPLAHVFGRMIQVAMVMQGAKLAHSDPARLVKDLQAVRPTFVLSVPQVFEKVFETARRKAAADGKGRIFARAAAVAIAYSQAAEQGRPGLLLSVQHLVFDRLVYGKLRLALGGRATLAVSGGAPLGTRMAHFFRGVGVTVLEGYGLTETTAAAAVNTARHQRVGTVGRALHGFEIMIAPDGEVLLRGGHVFTGYWNDEEATRAALDADGWLHTGDLGRLDAEGYLTITGRSKEIIVTAGGKNVAPAALEDVVRAHPVVAQVMVVGDRRSFVAALVTVDQEGLDQWLVERKRAPAPLADLTEDADLRAAIQSAIDAANATVSDAERIRRFSVLSVTWTEDTGHLTPTMKLKRAQVLADFAADVEALYASRA